MDQFQLQEGPNDLYKFIDRGDPLERILTEGRLLKSNRHDLGGLCDENGLRNHIHWYRKILEDYDPESRTVLLSMEGSKRVMGNLDIPDRLFSIEELYHKDWMVKLEDHVVH